MKSSGKILLVLLFGVHLAKVSWGQPVIYRAKKVHATPVLTYQPGEILVEGGKIKAIGKSVKKPAKCKIIEWKELEIYPGLISPGASLGLAEINALRPTRDEREVGSHTPEVEAWVAINPDSELIPVARANGIAHALVVPMGGTISGTSGLIALDGWGVEEMAVKKKVALHLWWPGHGISLPSSMGNSETKSIDDQVKERKSRIREIDEFFDQAEAYRNAREAKVANFSKIPGWEAMLPVLSRKLPLMIHADDIRQIKAAVEWAIKRDYRYVLSGGRDAWKLADWLAEKKTAVVYRHIFSAPSQRNQPHDRQYRAPAILAKAGVPLSIGLPLGAWSAANQRNLPYHVAQAIAYGLPREKALASITLEPAKLMGVDNRLGSLEIGKDATFLSCSGDLFDLRSSVKHLILSGREVNMGSRHTRLYERYAKRPRGIPNNKEVQSKDIVIRIDSSGKYFLNDHLTKQDSLEKKLREMQANHVLIRAHSGVPYTQIVQLMEITSRLGIRKVTLATDKSP